MSHPQSNYIIDNLPAELRHRLLAEAEQVALPIRTQLFHPDRPVRHMHFLTSGIASVVTPMSNGQGIEVGLNGNEGAVESIHLLGPERGTTECFVQIEATAYQVDFKRFQEEFYPLVHVRALMHRHVQYLSLIMGQIVACNRVHSVEERLARWLLMVADRVGQPRFRLTQEFLAEMTGSRQSNVTLSAAILKRSGLIDYVRGEIQILDRSSLEDAACECYPITRTLLGNFQSQGQPASALSDGQRR